MRKHSFLSCLLILSLLAGLLGFSVPVSAAESGGTIAGAAASVSGQTGDAAPVSVQADASASSAAASGAAVVPGASSPAAAEPAAAALTDTAAAPAEPENLGAPIQSAQTLDAAYGKEDGVNVVYTTVTGSASSGEFGTFNVIDIDNQKLLRSFPLTGISNAWSHLVTPDGRVFIGASSKMFVYDPALKSVRDLGMPIPGTESIWSLTSDENGNVYGGIYSTSARGRIFKIDAATLAVSDLLGGALDDGTAPGDDGKPEDYVRSIVYYKGFLYAGTASTNGRVWKVNPVTLEKTRIELPGSPSDPIYNGMYDKMKFVYGLTVVDHNLFVFFNGPLTMHVYDLDAQQWKETAYSGIRGLMAVTGYRNGKVYTSKQDKQMWEIDVATLTERPVMPFDGSIRSSKWIQVANQPEFPDGAMVTITYDGRVALYDPPRKLVKILPRVVQGLGINLQTIETGPDGKIYISSYMGSEGARYDPASGMFTLFPLGQSEGIGHVGDTLYFGVYPKAEIFGWDTKTPLPTTKGPDKLFDIGQEQDRPFVLTEGAGKLLIGTIPGYSTFGGAMTIYDPAASAASGKPEVEVFRNVVQDQSIAGLLYKDGLIYGSTSISGGLGDAPNGVRAKLFVWDMAAKKKIAEWEPQISGLDSLPMISGLTLGKDGLIWAAANGIVFAFDPVTHAVVKSKNLYPEVKNYGKWRPVHQRWTTDGLLVTDAGEKLTVVDPVTMGSTKLSDKTALFTLDAQNRIYAASATKVLRYPAPAKPAPPEPGTPTVPSEGKSYLDVRNAGFEETGADGSIPGWSVKSSGAGVSSFAASGEQKKAGALSLKLTDASTAVSSALQSDPLTVVPGRDYVANVHVFLGNPPVNPATGQSFSSSRTSASVRYYDAAGKEIADAGLSKNIDAPPKQWIPVELSSKAPANAAAMRVILLCSPSWVTTAYYDEVSVYTPVTPGELPKVSAEPAAADVPAGTDVTLSVKATAGAAVLVREGDEVAAQGTGGGDTPVTLAIPAPAAGKHSYTVTANVPGLGSSGPVSVPSVTVHALSALEAEAPQGLLQAGESFPVRTYGVYGPLRTEVTEEAVLSTASPGIVRVAGSTVTGLAKGSAVVNVSFGGRQTRLTVTVTDYELQAVELRLPKTTLVMHESLQASVYGVYRNGIPGGELIKPLAGGVRLTAKPAQRVTVNGLTVTGKSPGTTMIMAEFGGKSVQAQLTVIPKGHGKREGYPDDRVSGDDRAVAKESGSADVYDARLEADEGLE